MNFVIQVLSLLKVAILTIIHIRPYAIHVHPDSIFQIVKVRQFEDSVAILFVLLDIILHMLGQIAVYCAHKVISVPDEIKT